MILFRILLQFAKNCKKNLGSSPFDWKQIWDRISWDDWATPTSEANFRFNHLSSLTLPPQIVVHRIGRIFPLRY